MEKFVEFAVHGLFHRDAEMDIDGGNGMRERADGNVIDSCLGKIPHRFQCDSAGRFERDPARNNLNSFAGLLRVEVVEEYNIGAGTERSLELLEIANFD